MVDFGLDLIKGSCDYPVHNYMLCDGSELKMSVEGKWVAAKLIVDVMNIDGEVCYDPDFIVGELEAIVWSPKHPLNERDDLHGIVNYIIHDIFDKDLMEVSKWMNFVKKFKFENMFPSHIVTFKDEECVVFKDGESAMQCVRDVYDNYSIAEIVEYIRKGKKPESVVWYPGYVSSVEVLYYVKVALGSESWGECLETVLEWI